MAQYASDDDGNGKTASSDADQCLRYHHCPGENMVLLNWMQESNHKLMTDINLKTRVIFRFLKGLGGAGFFAFARNEE